MSAMRVFVFNGWAAGPEAWRLCTFRHDWLFSYIEQLDGLPERVMAETEAAVLVGFSMGGSSALRLTLAHPEKVRGLVLVSATARMMEEKSQGWAGMSARRLAALKLGTETCFRGDPSPTYAQPDLDRGLAYLRNTDLRADLLGARDRLGAFPVRIFQSERDGIVRPSNAAFLKEVFSQAEVTLVSGNEHVLPVTIPGQIDAAVREVKGEGGER